MNAEMSLAAVNCPLLSAQRVVLEEAQKLLAINQRLYELAESLPLPSAYILMEQGQLAYSGLGQLYSTLSQVKKEHLRKAVEALLEVAQQTDIKLSLKFAAEN
jgi:hypothetical protein